MVRSKLVTQVKRLPRKFASYGFLSQMPLQNNKIKHASCEKQDRMLVFSVNLLLLSEKYCRLSMRTWRRDATYIFISYTLFQVADSVGIWKIIVGGSSSNNWIACISIQGRSRRGTKGAVAPPKFCAAIIELLWKKFHERVKLIHYSSRQCSLTQNCFLAMRPFPVLLLWSLKQLTQLFPSTFLNKEIWKFC